MDDFIGDVADAHADEFWAVKRGVEVEVGNVHGHESRPRSGDNAVEENFCDEHVGGGGGDFARVVDAIATHDKASAVGFVLFWSDGADKLTVCDVTEAVVWDVLFAYKKDGVGAFHPSAYAVGKSTKLVGRGLGPVCVVIGVTQELSVVEKFSSSFIHDCQSFVCLTYSSCHAFVEDRCGGGNA